MDYSNHNDEQFNPQNSKTIVLVGYTRHNHKMGPIQKSNLVRLGDVLVEINGVSVRNMSFRRVMDLLKCLVYGGSGNPNGEKNGMYNENNNSGSSHRAVTLNSLAFEDGRMYYYTHFDNQEMRNTFNTDALSLLSGGIIGGGNTNTNGASGENNSAIFHANKQWNVARENVLYSFSSWIQRARLRQEEEEEEPRSSPQSPTQQSSDGVGLNEMNMNPQVRFEEPDLHLDSSFDDITTSAANTQTNDTNSNNKDRRKPNAYVQYEIKCVLKIKQNNQEEEETTWSIWKRYSELKKLDEHLRKTFHWSMESIKFPSSNLVRSVMYGSIHSKFVQKRKNELEYYWKELCCDVDGLFDFGDPHSSHRYSYKMAEFLDLKREYFQPRLIGPGGGGTGAVSVTSSKPNVIQVEGAMMMDESSLSMLSNSADGGGNNGGGVAQGEASSGQLSGGGSGGVGGGGGANKSTTGDMSVTSESGVLSTNGLASGKKKKKRKKVVAKSAYQRGLMDDL